MPQINKFIVLAVAASGFLAGCHSNHTAYGLTTDGHVVSFNTDSPGTIDNAVSISGLNSGQGVARMVLDPISDQIYCITSDNFLCTLDPTSGAATLVSSTPFNLNGEGITLSNPVLGFDPTAQALRVIDSTFNLLVDPTSGAVLFAESKIAYAGGDTHPSSTTPSLAGMAYVPDKSSTTLYALDAATTSLVNIGEKNVSGTVSANGGQLHTIGSTNVSFSTPGGFAIDGSSGDAYAILQATGTSPVLYSVDLDTGAASSEGTLGTIDNNGSTLTFDSLVIAP